MESFTRHEAENGDLSQSSRRWREVRVFRESRYSHLVKKKKNWEKKNKSNELESLLISYSQCGRFPHPVRSHGVDSFLLIGSRSDFSVKFSGIFGTETGIQTLVGGFC